MALGGWLSEKVGYSPLLLWLTVLRAKDFHTGKLRDKLVKPNGSIIYFYVERETTNSRRRLCREEFVLIYLIFREKTEV